MKTLIIAVALAGAVASAALVGAAGPARATHPGVANGRIAFGATRDGNTDVYSVLPNGAAAQRLTDDPGADICPAYSADGKWVAWCGPRRDLADEAKRDREAPTHRLWRVP
jgi:Tol biopolymer transport system component